MAFKCRTDSVTRARAYFSVKSHGFPILRVSETCGE